MVRLTGEIGGHEFECMTDLKQWFFDEGYQYDDFHCGEAFLLMGTGKYVGKKVYIERED